MRERLCVVMPVFNERDAIGAVLAKWDDALAALGIDYEIRPYNDGSRDDSLSVMRGAAAGRPRISVRDKKNGGHGNTILTGYREAAADGFDWIFQVDSDDEMGPEKFSELWNRRSEFDFGVGIRDGRKQALPRKIISFVSRLCVRLFYGKSVWDVNTPYRLMRVSAFRGYFERIPLSTFAPNVILSGLAGAAGLRCHEIRVPQHDRATGEVSIKKWKLLKAAVRSFWQTIWFAASGAAIAPVPTSRRLSRAVCMAGCLAGLAFTLLMVSKTPYLAMSIAVAALAMFAGRVAVVRRFFRCSFEWLERHWLLGFCLMLSVGLALRGLLYALNTDISSYQIGDTPYFWECARKMAAGSFPIFKSWGVPGVYALAIRAFGDGIRTGVGVNVFLQLVTSVVLLAFTSRIVRSRAAGVLAAAGYFLSARFIGFAFLTYGEHLYFLLLALALLLLDVWRVRMSVVVAASLAVLAVVTLYTRSEGGLLLLLLVPGLFILTALPGRRGVMRVVWSLVAFAAIAGCGLFAGMKVNEKYHGTRCILCSHDGWWPRLYGANLKSEGRSYSRIVERDVNAGEKGVGTLKKIGNGDKPLIQRRYAEATGVKITFPRCTCPEEFVPLIKEEISRRWNDMPLSVKGKFVLKKERHCWANARAVDAMFAGKRGLAMLARALDFALHCILAAAAFLTLWRFLRWTSLFGVGEDDRSRMLFSLVPIIYCVGVACIIAVAESNSRYRLVASFLLTPYLASLFKWCVQRTGGGK